MKDITIYCVNLQKSVQVREGLTLLEIYRLLGVELPHQVLCARVNNKTEDLNYCVYNPKQIEFIDITHGSGSRAYVRSLCFVLSYGNLEKNWWCPHHLDGHLADARKS